MVTQNHVTIQMKTPIGVRVVQFSAGDNFHYGVFRIGDTYRIGALRGIGEFGVNVQQMVVNQAKCAILYGYPYTLYYLYVFWCSKLVPNCI